MTHEIEKIINAAQNYEVAVEGYRRRDTIQITDDFDDNDGVSLFDHLSHFILSLGDRTEATELTKIQAKCEEIFENDYFSKNFPDTPIHGWHHLNGLIEQYIMPEKRVINILWPLEKEPAELVEVLNKQVQFNEKIFDDYEANSQLGILLKTFKNELEKIHDLSPALQEKAIRLCSGLEQNAELIEQESAHTASLKEKFEPLKMAIKEYAKAITQQQVTSPSKTGHGVFKETTSNMRKDQDLSIGPFSVKKSGGPS